MSIVNPPSFNTNIFNNSAFDDLTGSLNLSEADDRYLKLTGGTLTGALSLNNELNVIRTSNGEAIRINNGTVFSAMHLQTSNCHIGTTSNHNFNIQANGNNVIQCLNTGVCNILNGLTVNASSSINTLINYNGVMNTSSLVLRQISNTNNHKVSLDFIVSGNVIDTVNTAGSSIFHERTGSSSQGDLCFSVKKTALSTAPLVEILRLKSTGVATFSNTSDNKFIEWTDGICNAATFINSSNIPSIGTTTNHGLGFFTNNGSSSQLFLSATSQRVGIGLNNPTFQFQVSTDSAAKPTSNTWTISSDQRIKEDIIDADLDICYNNIKNLKLKRYKYNDKFIKNHNVNDIHKLGWIAQDVKKVIPKAVFINRNEDYDIDDFHSLNTDQIISCMYGSIQKLIFIIEKHEEFINSLELE